MFFNFKINNNIYNNIYSSPITKPFYPGNPDEDVDVMEEDDVTNSNQDPCKVILYNDDIHTFDEVATQIIIATKCSTEKADALTWEVHSKGKAIVYSGDMNECLRVSGILEEIGLNTQIEI
ncbi:MAG: ATP-dependent Clp protease adaptor ClpS [Candidatus Kapaibacteriota bacterium]|jgi:ATP-dependent Clp protease adaptor protein ClpS